MTDLSFLNGVELTELHAHLGFSVSPTMLWEIAHEQGLKLPTKSYWEFEKLVTIYEKKDYEEYLQLYDLTEKIQSSPEALFTAAQTAVSSAYRKNNITGLELRFNPILRNRNGDRDLDHLIVFTLQGMERAMLKYPVKVGIILMMDRRFSEHENATIVKKAIKYKNRGVVGIDLAGPITLNDHSKSFSPKQIAHMIKDAKTAGLGITIHTGEATNADEMWDVLETLAPHRIGHGIACVADPKLMKRLSDHHIVLETCPTSNLHTKLIKDFDHMQHIYQTLKKHHVPFTINTDGPEMQRTSLRGEYELLLKNNILTKEDLLKANDIARNASFIYD
ncbi:adenosine deaminase [Candidatus Gottesmanbacteria bacterium]|nr:adenosine deaminase [Candidatus Gottesmanbacteria bacterium]